VGIDAQNLVGEDFGRDPVEEHLRPVALDDLVAFLRFRRVVDLELDSVVALLCGDPQRAHPLQRLDRVLVDLEHRRSIKSAGVCGAGGQARATAGAFERASHTAALILLPRRSSATSRLARVYNPPMRILIAEDETIIRLDLRDLLERAGHEVVGEARDGEEAVALAKELEPDLAIMDVKMPRLDGIEAARRILDDRPMPIVLLTAYGQQELVARAVEAGVFGYLVKPFREQDLVPAIETARARHAELAAVREEAESLADALAARKAIERAKGLLMEKEGLSEADAFDRLRRASQVSGRPLKVIAEAVVDTLGGE
jgi:AmiR/NasT family two-component response regulator